MSALCGWVTWISGTDVRCPSCSEQDVILTDAIADTLATNIGPIAPDSTTYRGPAGDTNLAPLSSMTRAL